MIDEVLRRPLLFISIHLNIKCMKQVIWRLGRSSSPFLFVAHVSFRVATCHYLTLFLPLCCVYMLTWFCNIFFEEWPDCLFISLIVFFLLCWPAEEFLLNRLPFGKSNGIRILNSQFLLFPSKKQRHTHTIYNADKLNTLSSNNSSVYGNTLCLCTTLTISLLLLLLLLGCRLFYK